MDHFAPEEKEAFEHTRNIVSTLNFELPEEDGERGEEPLYDSEQLRGFAPKEYSHSLDVKMVTNQGLFLSRSRCPRALRVFVYSTLKNIFEQVIPQCGAKVSSCNLHTHTTHTQ